jgi:hypothetical protein
MVIINAARGYTKGRKDTVYTNQDFVVEPVVIVQEEKTTATEDDGEDIFSDIDI